MRMAVVFLGAVLASGCKDKPKTQPVGPATGDGSGSSGSEPKLRQRVPNAGPKEPKANVLDLPKSSKTPPLKTQKTLTKPELEKLSLLDYPGWKRDVRYLGDDTLEVRYKTEARPILGVTVIAGKCFDCLPMVLAKWKPKHDALKAMLVPELRDHPETIFELGETQLFGAPVIYTYQQGWAFGSDGHNQPAGAYSHAYMLRYNDGVNQVQVLTQYMDDPTATRADMINLAPREDLEKIGQAFLDAFTHSWAPAAK
jgi:hypothetical protein